MKTFIGGRCSGKTTAAIKASAETGAIIIAHNESVARCIAMQAKDLGYDIPNPIPIQRYFRRGIQRRNVIIIDELEAVLTSLLGSEIKMVTINENEVE